jgi:cobalt-precorrin-5B (C1)-methyltransferase
MDSTMLKRGWTTGACATAATRAALTALFGGGFPDPVEITLPKGETPAFALALEERGDGWARAGIIKDAGDDPDVTHGALIVATVRRGRTGTGVTFEVGDGVGMVTRPGLPIPPGEPAINPVPRQMMREIVATVTGEFGISPDIEIEISVPGGRELAQKTWNPRLGIEGGISILGTTGIVRPFSCSAWIHAIQSGINVARAEGLTHLAGATGSTSEAAVKKFHGLDDLALIDMGDFVGGMLKFLRTHPVPRITIAGGFAKMTKFAQGRLDLHSGRSQVDFNWLAARLEESGGDADMCAAARGANTALEVLEAAQTRDLDIAKIVACNALDVAKKTLRSDDITPDIVIIDRQGTVIAHGE